MDSSSRARAQLLALSQQLEETAEELWNTGASTLQDAARIAQLAEIASDEMVVEIRDKFVHEGMINSLTMVTGGDA